MSAVSVARRRLAAVTAAVAGAFAVAPAPAQVVIYGKLYPEVARIRLGEARAPGTPAGTLSAPGGAGAAGLVSRLQSSNSYFGFRGTEPLGGGVDAFWQLEQGVDVGTGVHSPRDTFVGLRTSSLTLRLGFFDTVYKDLGDQLRFFGLASGNFVSSSTTLSKPPIGSSSAASFHLRRANSMRADWAAAPGVGLHAQYSPDESRTDARNADLLSVGASWRPARWSLAVAFEQHRDTFGGSRSAPSAYRNDADPAASAMDRALRLTAVHALTDTISVEFNRAWLDYRERGAQAGRFESMRADAWNLALALESGPWRAQLTWAAGRAVQCRLRGDVACSVAGQDGRMINAGVGYALSRRTLLFGLAGHLRNGAGASYNSTDVLTVLSGQPVLHVAAGILHAF